MAIESADVFRSVARAARLVLIAALMPAGMAVGQLPIHAPAPVTAGSVVPFNHGSTKLWGQIYSMKMAPNGNILFLDSADSAIYQLAPGASEPTLVVGAEPSNTPSDCSLLEASGTYWNAAIAFDSQNNLYVTDRYGSAVQFCRVPYNATTGTWTFTGGTDIWAGPTVTSNGTSTPVMPQDLVVGDDGTFYVSWSTQGEIDKFTVNSSGTVSSVTRLITGLEQYAASLAVDHAGNLFFIENIYGSTLGTRVPGIYEIPAGTSGLNGNGTGTIETSLTRIDSAGAGFDGISGLAFDAQGNLYFSSINNTSYSGNVAGVFMIPNEGSPTSPSLNWNDTVMVSPVYAGHPVLVDPRGYIWIATGGSGNWAPTGTIAPNCDSTSQATTDATCLYSSIVLWKPGSANVGATAVGAGSASAISAFSASASTGLLTLTANNSFTEDELVTISAPSGDPLAALSGMSFYVSGTGLSSSSFEISTTLVTGSGSTAATVAPAGIATLYYSFSQATTPQSIAFGQVGSSNFKAVANPTPDPSVTPAVPPCTAGTAYPAFSSTETSIPLYSWCSLFVQMTPTAAGQTAGEAQMLDASNNVISGSNGYVTGVGQAAAISNLATPAEQSIAQGLSAPEQVAADALGNTYVADSGLSQVVMFPAGSTSSTSGTAVAKNLSGLTGVAIDGAGNVYVGANGGVSEIPNVNGKFASTVTPIASGFGSQLNLATDSQGDVFVADKTNKQVVEIPNPQSALLLVNEPAIKLGTSAGFSGPTAIATDSSGNVWVADGDNLWEITMPFGGATEVLTGLQGPVTGLAVDPSGSVFITDAAGLVWIPYQASSGEPNINGLIHVAAGFGTSGSVLPIGVAVDGLQNVYAIYGSGSTAGMAQVGIGGSIDFNNYGEINPNVPFETDAQLFNLGNTPLTLAAFSSDAISGAGSANYSVGAATLNAPACVPGTGTAPGGSCYLGLTIQASAAGQENASVAVMSNAVNAATGLNIAVATNVIQDLRPASSVQPLLITPTPSSGAVYPGVVTVTVTVTSSAGTPGGSVNLTGSSANGTLAEQTQSLNGSGVTTFTLSGLLGGAYTVNATYTGEGTAGATQNTCASSSPACFAGSAAKATFVVAPAKPTFTVAAPAGSTGNLTVYNGSTFLSESQTDSITATVNSSFGTPTGTVTFCLTYTNGTCTPADATQGVNGAIALNGQGQATFSTNNLPVGTYNLTALYSGDVNYAQQSLALPAFQVIVPSIEITSSPTTATITPGTPAQTTLTLTPLVGFSSEGVFVECVAATLPPYSECTFNNPEVSVSGGPSTIVVTISTNVPVNGGTTASVARQAPWSLAGLFGLGLLGLIARRKRINAYLAMLCLACMFSGLFLGITACTNAGYSTPPPAPKVTTPTGTYNVQIITYDPANSQQNSLQSPAFVLPTTVQ